MADSLLSALLGGVDREYSAGRKFHRSLVAGADWQYCRAPVKSVATEPAGGTALPLVDFPGVNKPLDQGHVRIELDSSPHGKLMLQIRRSIGHIFVPVHAGHAARRGSARRRSDRAAEAGRETGGGKEPAVGDCRVPSLPFADSRRRYHLHSGGALRPVCSLLGMWGTAGANRGLFPLPPRKGRDCKTSGAKNPDVLETVGTVGSGPAYTAVPGAA